MVVIRDVNTIVQNFIDFYRANLPDADIKPGQVIRDLFIEAPSAQLALLYQELAAVMNKGSVRNMSGTDLEKYVKNFGIVRRYAVQASGTAVLTFNSLNAPFTISQGDLVFASNGMSFSVTNSVGISSSNANYYKSIATKYKNDLDYIGIKDQYAIEILVKCTSAGTVGNLSKYSISRTNISNISNATNITSFNGGTNSESDTSLQDRFLTVFSGSNTGTALGYLNTALSVDGVSAAQVIEPGDPLMTRDGTITQKQPDGSVKIVSEGAGGKVDVIVLGSTLSENIDSFIYKDKSNNNNPSDAKNNIVLGQIPGDSNKTILKRRKDNIAAKALPAQPVQSIVTVTGSLSGNNFIAKTTDEYGRVSGNYELIKDIGSYAGTPWGFDAFHWVDNKVTGFTEDKVKGQYNGQDGTIYNDVLDIPLVRQNINITNENSIITSDNSIIQLLHVPISRVSRAFNVNTGESYVVANQNLVNGINTTGKIKISGSTLPKTTDVLQVDYVWSYQYDKYSDYDGLINTNNARSVKDSVDWGYSNLINKEVVDFAPNSEYNSATIFSGKTKHKITNVIAVNQYKSLLGTIERGTDVYADRLIIKIDPLIFIPNTIDSVKVDNSNIEIYNTQDNNGLLLSSASTLRPGQWTITIILPTDAYSYCKIGDKVNIKSDKTDAFTVDNISGSFNGNLITLPKSNVSYNYSYNYPSNYFSTTQHVICEVDYISDTQNVFNGKLDYLSAIKAGNGFRYNKNSQSITSTNINNSANSFIEKNIIQSVISREVLTIQAGLYIDLNVLSDEFDLNLNDILSVVRQSDGYELCNPLHPCTITTNLSTGAYRLTLSSYNTPISGDICVVFYMPRDKNRCQALTYSFEPIQSRIDSVKSDGITGEKYIDIFKMENQLGTITLIDLNATYQNSPPFYLSAQSYGNISFTPIDGYAKFEMLSISPYPIIDFSEPKYNWSNRIIDTLSNTSLSDLNRNVFKVKEVLDNTTLSLYLPYEYLALEQVYIVKISDNQEVWSFNGRIDHANNRIYFPSDVSVSHGDKVYFTYGNINQLKKSQSKLIVTATDQVANSGTIQLSGTTLTKAEVIFSVSDSNISKSNLKINAIEALAKALNVSASSIPSNVGIAKIAKIEKVTTVSSTNDIVTSVITNYNLINIKLQTEVFDPNNIIENRSLSRYEFVLPNTTNNTLVSSTTNHLPTLGSKIRIAFYYYTYSDVESLNFSRNGTLYTNKMFASIDNISTTSGYTKTSSATVSIGSMNQPTTGSRYKISYDYIAPKQNERITIKTNYNQIITDTTFQIELKRPINADVLVKEAVSILVDVTMYVVISQDYLTQSSLVVQNLKDALIGAMTITDLGAILDASDLINTAYTVSGIDRVTVSNFNRANVVGQVLSIIAQKNEYFLPNNIVINIESR